jgi:hypothetical protein
MTLMMTFSVHGPFDVPFYKGRGGRTITTDDVRRFWSRHGHYAKRRGCYVVGIRAGKGLIPAYVGMATRAFKGEVFAPQKLAGYQQFLADFERGTPIVFFLAAPARKGASNAPQIKALERFLVEVAVAKNPRLLNVRGTKSEEWRISGLVRSGSGKPSRAARAFRRLMSL